MSSKICICRGCFTEQPSGVACVTCAKVEAERASPVVERQSNVIDLDAVDWEAIQEAADESNWMPNEYMRNEWVSDVCNFLKYGRAEHPAPPELAELQATIARLTAENERVGEFRRRWIRRTLKARDERDQLKTEIERLKGGQGEAVAWSYCPECGCEDLHHEQGEHKQCANCYQEWFSDIDYSEVVRGNLAKLKASQPAPVSVLLPEREHVHSKTLPFRNPAIGDGYISGWNACLDKVKELNQ